MQKSQWQDQFSPLIQSLINNNNNTPPTSATPPSSSSTPVSHTHRSITTDNHNFPTTTKTTDEEATTTTTTNTHQDNKTLKQSSYNHHIPSWLSDTYADVWTFKLRHNDKRNMLNMRELLTRPIDVESPIWFFLPRRKRQVDSKKTVTTTSKKSSGALKKETKKLPIKNHRTKKHGNEQEETTTSDNDDKNNEANDHDDNKMDEFYDESYRVACWTAIKREMYRLLKSDRPQSNDNDESTTTTTAMMKNKSHKNNTIYAYHNVAVLCFHLNEIHVAFQLMDMLIDSVFHVTFLRTIAYFYMQNNQLLNAAVVLHHLIRDSYQKYDDENEEDDDRSVDYHSIYLTMRLFSRHLIESDESLTNNREELLLFRRSIMECVCSHKPNNHLYRLWMEKWDEEISLYANNESKERWDTNSSFSSSSSSVSSMKPKEALFDTLQLLNQMLGKDTQHEEDSEVGGGDEGDRISHKRKLFISDGEENEQEKHASIVSVKNLQREQLPSISNIMKHQFHLNFVTRNAKKKSMVMRCFGFLRNVLTDYRVFVRIMGTIATIIGVTLFTKVIARVFGASGRVQRKEDPMFQSILQSFYGSVDNDAQSMAIEGPNKKSAAEDFFSSEHNDDIKSLQMHHGASLADDDDTNHDYDNQLPNARIIIRPTHLTPKTSYKSPDEIESDRVILSDFEYVDNLYREISDFSKLQLQQQQEFKRQKQSSLKQSTKVSPPKQAQNRVPRVTSLSGTEGVLGADQQQLPKTISNLTNRTNVATSQRPVKAKRSTATNKSAAAPPSNKNVKVFGRK